MTWHLDCQPALSPYQSIQKYWIKIKNNCNQSIILCAELVGSLTAVCPTLFPAVHLWLHLHLWNQKTYFNPKVSQCLRLSTSLSGSERRPPKPMLCLLQREKSLLINLLQTAWRKWPGGCKLSLGEEDEGHNREGWVDRVWERKRDVKKEKKKEKLRYTEMEKGESRKEGGGEKGKRERRKCVCLRACVRVCVCLVCECCVV